MQIFSCESLREGTAKDSEVLGEDVDQAPVHATRPGDDPVAEHPLLLEAEIGATVSNEAVQLDKGPGIQQEIESLAGGELPLAVLLGQAFRPPALFGKGLLVMKLIEKLARIGHALKAKAGRTLRKGGHTSGPTLHSECRPRMRTRPESQTFGRAIGSYGVLSQMVSGWCRKRMIGTSCWTSQNANSAVFPSSS